MMMLYPNGEDFFIMALTLHYLSMSIYKKKKKKKKKKIIKKKFRVGPEIFGSVGEPETQLFFYLA